MISLNSVRPFCWFHTYYLITTRFRINNGKISRVIILLSNRTLSALKCPVYKGFQKIFIIQTLLYAFKTFFQYNPSCLLCDFRRCFCSSFLLQYLRCLLCSVCVDRDIAVHFCIIGSCFYNLRKVDAHSFFHGFKQLCHHCRYVSCYLVHAV